MILFLCSCSVSKAVKGFDLVPRKEVNKSRLNVHCACYVEWSIVPYYSREGGDGPAFFVAIHVIFSANTGRRAMRWLAT